MMPAEIALTLMAEAAAHSITILYGDRELGITTMRDGQCAAPVELLEDIDAYANEIWAVMFGYRHRAQQAGGAR